jgi:DNA-binding response OmpR family regulator
VEIKVASTTLRRKVLIIEDEPSIRNVLYVLLAALGCDGQIAYDTRQALSMIREGSFEPSHGQCATSWMMTETKRRAEEVTPITMYTA